MASSRPLNPALIEPARAMPRRVAIIGAGTIGPDIGYYLASEIAGLELVLIDIDAAALERARERIAGYAEKGVARGKLSAERAAALQERITTTTDYSALAGADWVLEAATERLELKREIFARVEAIVGPEALITSNTSSLPAERLFAGLAHPERATVTHFFAPAFRNPVVEVIDWAGAAAETVDFLVWLFEATGKVPLVTADVVCFMLDRVFDNWCNEAGHALAQATPAEVDSVAAEFVHAGPFFVLNLAHGNPIIVETNTLQAEVEGEHYRPAPVFAAAGRWDTVAPGERVEVDPAVREAVRDRLLGILFAQSVDIIDRGIGSQADLELGCRAALGFRRGPLALMGELGEAEVGRILAAFAALRPGMPMPRRPIPEYLRFRSHVLVDEVDGVKVLTLRRPDALNALDDRMTDELLEVIERHEGDGATRGFVITGYGPRAFCAGADIGRFPEMLGERERSVEYARACSRLLVRLDRCTVPVVAALNGMALGGGFELAMRCHGIVACERAWLQLPEITLGIVPGIGAMVVPYRRWPQAAAEFHEMITRARRMDAASACRLGVIDALVADRAALIEAAIARVGELAGRGHAIPDAPVPIPELPPGPAEAADGRALSAEVGAIARRAVRAAAAAPTFAEALEIGYQAFGESACTAAAREGIEAFLAGRRPDFGRTG